LSESRHEVLKAWIAAGLWLALIAVESTDLLSSSHTSRFLYPLLKYLFGPIDPMKFFYWHAIGRKVGHVVGYGILSLLLFRAWQVTLPLAGAPRWSWRWAQVAVFTTVLVASLDEWHQSYIPSRTGTWHDVVLDGTAGIAFQIVLYLFLRGRGSQRRQEASPGW
jgi:VanZ family protein